MNAFPAIVAISLKWILRDKILLAVLGVAFLLLMLVPAISSFSMRQVQELAITLSLSVDSLLLFIVALMLGSSSVWQDIDRRYAASVLTLPVSRRSYLLGKFCGISLFIACCGLVLGIFSAAAIILASKSYPSDIPIHWQNIALAVIADVVKYIFLASLAICFSSLSTSFFLPFFGTTAVYLAGTGSQEVFEYVSGRFGKEMNPILVAVIKGVYYLIPNFSAFNLKVYAIYGLPVPYAGIAYSLVYSIIYVSVLLTISVWIFSRRQLP